MLKTHLPLTNNPEEEILTAIKRLAPESSYQDCSTIIQMLKTQFPDPKGQLPENILRAINQSSLAKGSLSRPDARDLQEPLWRWNATQPFPPALFELYLRLNSNTPKVREDVRLIVGELRISAREQDCLSAINRLRQASLANIQDSQPESLKDNIEALAQFCPRWNEFTKKWINPNPAVDAALTDAATEAFNVIFMKCFSNEAPVIFREMALINLLLEYGAFPDMNEDIVSSSLGTIATKSPHLLEGIKSKCNELGIRITEERINRARESHNNPTSAKPVLAGAVAATPPSNQEIILNLLNALTPQSSHQDCQSIITMLKDEFPEGNPLPTAILGAIKASNLAPAILNSKNPSPKLLAPLWRWNATQPFSPALFELYLRLNSRTSGVREVASTIVGELRISAREQDCLLAIKRLKESSIANINDSQYIDLKDNIEALAQFRPRWNKSTQTWINPEPALETLLTEAATTALNVIFMQCFSDSNFYPSKNIDLINLFLECGASLTYTNKKCLSTLGMLIQKTPQILPQVQEKCREIGWPLTEEQIHTAKTESPLETAKKKAPSREPILAAASSATPTLPDSVLTERPAPLLSSIPTPTHPDASSLSAPVSAESAPAPAGGSSNAEETPNALEKAFYVRVGAYIVKAALFLAYGIAALLDSLNITTKASDWVESSRAQIFVTTTLDPQPTAPEKTVSGSPSLHAETGRLPTATTEGTTNMTPQIDADPPQNSPAQEPTAAPTASP